MDRHEPGLAELRPPNPAGFPRSRSTSSRSRANASLMRMPVTASSPKIVEYVRPFSPRRKGVEPAARTRPAISASL